MFFVRTSSTSLKLTETSASLPWSKTTTYDVLARRRPLDMNDPKAYVLIVFALLIRAGASPRLRLLRPGECLQRRYLRVQSREILLDDVRQLGNLYGPVIKERLPFGHCGAVNRQSSRTQDTAAP